MFEDGDCRVKATVCTMVQDGDCRVVEELETKMFKDGDCRYLFILDSLCHFLL